MLAQAPNKSSKRKQQRQKRAVVTKQQRQFLPGYENVVGLQPSWLQGLPGGDYMSRLGKNWYLDALVDPLSVPAARFPGDISIPTAVYKSVRVMEVPINTASGGRFSCFVTPRLGSNGVISALSTYIATSNFPYGQPDQNTTLGFYATGPGNNPRIDQNALVLCASANEGVYITSSTVPATVSSGRVAPFGDTSYQPGLGNQSVRFTNGRTTTIQSSYVPYNIGYKTTRPNDINSERASVFYLDAGVYSVQLDIEPLTASDTDFRFSQGLGVIITGLEDAAGFDHSGLPKIRSSYTQTEGRKVSFILDIPGSSVLSGNNWFAVQTDLAPVPPTPGQPYAYGFIQRITQTEVSNLGIVKQLRPVACSALLTYIGTDFNNGGQIASAFVAPETLATNYLNTNLATSDTGELDLHEFTAVTRIPGSYSGPLRTGSYAFWTPSGVDTYKFRSPTEHVKTNYGGLVFAGNWAPTEINSTVQLRLTVVTHYEYTTTSLLFPAVYSPYEPRTEVDAYRLLSNFPRAMPNDTHEKMIDKIRRGIKTGLGLVSKVAPIALSML